MVNDGAGDGRVSSILKATIHHIGCCTGIPHMLFPVQKQHRMVLCQKLLTHYEKERIVFLQQIITIYDTWMCNFKPDLKFQSEVWMGKKFTTTKILTSSPQGGTNDDNGLRLYRYNCHIHIVLYGHTVDQNVYVHVLRKMLRHKVWQTRSQMLNHVIILRDNALHIARSLLSQLYTYRQIDENVKKCWRTKRNEKCIDDFCKPSRQ